MRTVEERERDLSTLWREIKQVTQNMNVESPNIPALMRHHQMMIMMEQISEQLIVLTEMLNLMNIEKIYP